MKIILNYSHPLGDTVQRQISEAVGEFREVIVPCQIDFALPLQPQLEALEAAGDTAVREAGGWLWAIVPPALSYAAAWIGGRRAYAISDATPPQPCRMIVLRREGAPPQFVLAEIL